MYNQVHLIGNVGTAPEFKSFPDGGRIGNFSLATSRSWKDRDTGEFKEITQWHRVILRGTYDIQKAEEHLEKGMTVTVVGEVVYRKWTDNSGTERKTCEINIPQGRGKLIIHGRRNQSEATEPTSSYSDTSHQSPDEDRFGEDEIPF